MQQHIARDEGYAYLPTDDYENFYYCTDIEIASMLVCKKYTLVDIVPERNGKATFVFHNMEGIPDAIKAFWSNRIDVHPLEFANTRKNLKSRIFGMQTH